MSIPELVVDKREKLGKGESGRIRKSGKIPAVVYGLGRDPFSVSVVPKQISEILHSEKGLNTVVNLRLSDSEDTRYVMIKDLTRHAVTSRITHVDFLRVDMDKEVTSVMPIETVGVPAGAKLGGVLTTVRHEIEIRCKPKDLQGTLKLNVTGLGLDEAIRVKDLPQIEGVEYLLGPNRVIAVVHPENMEIPSDSDEEDEDAA
jgi:large subunit ribosomal protein L25